MCLVLHGDRQSTMDWTNANQIIGAWARARAEQNRASIRALFEGGFGALFCFGSSSSVAVETLPKYPDANAERVRLAQPNTRKTQQTQCLGMKSINSVRAPAFGRSTDESTSLPQTQSMSNPAARRLQSFDPSRAPTAENLARGQSLIFWGRAGPASARVIAFAFVLRSCFVFFVFAWVCVCGAFCCVLRPFGRHHTHTTHVAFATAPQAARASHVCVCTYATTDVSGGLDA